MKDNVKDIDGLLVNKSLDQTIELPPKLTDPDRHTDDIQEIITKVPPWMLRWGIAIVFSALLTAIGAAALIKYPDTIRGQLKISSSAIPTQVLSPTSGVIKSLFAEKGKFVKKGQLLVILRTADTDTTNIIAPSDGVLSSVSVVQPGARLNLNQVLFFVHPMNEQFFGEMKIPILAIDKIKEKQHVIITLHNTIVEDPLQFRGTIGYITDEPLNGYFTAKIKFINPPIFRQRNQLKNWMKADAEIITQDKTVLSRIVSNFSKSLKL